MLKKGADYLARDSAGNKPVDVAKNRLITKKLEGKKILVLY